MRTGLLLVALCGCGLLVATAASAAPSHLGPTGIVGTPTADVVGDRHYDVAADFVRYSDDDIDGWPLRLVAGVSDKVEAGIGYTKWKDGGSLKVMPINVKAMLVPESERSPAVAVGAAYGKLKDGSSIKVTTFYAVATKTLSEPEEDYYYDEGGMKGTVRGSLGVMYNKYSNSGSESATEPFISLEYMTADAKTTLAAEYKTSEDILSDDALLSFVARHMFTPNMWAQVGWTNTIYTLANDDHGWFIGVGYSWAPPVEEEWYY
jgi:hypothetical protein